MIQQVKYFFIQMARRVFGDCGNTFRIGLGSILYQYYVDIMI